MVYVGWMQRGAAMLMITYYFSSSCYSEVTEEEVGIQGALASFADFTKLPPRILPHAYAYGFWMHNLLV
jgi:hypothetical protein